MKKRILTLTLASIIAICSFNNKTIAQEYNRAVGVTIGGAIGIDYKQFISRAGALEFGFEYDLSYHAPMFTAVYQHHFPLTAGLALYAGGGINLGAINVGKHRSSEFAIGIDPNIGIEYKFANQPITLGVDYKPAINLSCASMWDVAGLKIRYTF